jgi:hypothetical protein
MARGGPAPEGGAGATRADPQAAANAEESPKTDDTEKTLPANDPPPKAESETTPADSLAAEATSEEPTPVPPSRTMIIGLSLAVGLVLMGLFVVMLRGGHEGK